MIGSVATKQSTQGELAPFQAKALQQIEDNLHLRGVTALIGRPGLGKSMIARELARRLGAAYFCIEDYIDEARYEPYLRSDERVHQRVKDAFDHYDVVILDDYTFFYSYPIGPRRERYSHDAADDIHELARSLGKTLILVGRSAQPNAVAQEMAHEAVPQEIYKQDRTTLLHLGPELEPEDMAAIAARMLGDECAAAIDFGPIAIQAPFLCIRQLKFALAMLHAGKGKGVGTAALLDVLSRYVVRDNVCLDEVEALDFANLPGTEQIAEALETHVLFPFEHPEEARRTGVTARRGVMLFGPPGTGKTSIGRALARRLQGKFFLIDGSIGTEPPHFFIARIRAIVNRAIASAPCVLFIDDADNLFTIPHVAGIVRYLLTVLDSIQSEKASRVCVMMTVMDARKIPDALVRSGRVELWLEVKTPSVDVRAGMLRRWKTAGLPEHESVDYHSLAALADGMTAADLRRVMDDACLLHARAVQTGAPLLSATAYIERSIGDLRTMRARMASKLGQLS